MPDEVEDPGLVIPLHREDVAIHRRVVEQGFVRVSTHTVTNDVAVRETLSQDVVSVERVAVGRYVQSAPAVRQDGDCTIIPVIEEVLVVEKRLFLKEELRIRRSKTTRLHEETVSLRREEAVIVREAAIPSNHAADRQGGDQPPKELTHGD